MVSITDGHVSALRSFLGQDFTDSQRRHRILGDASEATGYAELVVSALIVAARRRFVPPWSRADVIRYVADVRKREISHDDLDPAVAETALLRALGQRESTDSDMERWMRAQIFLLEALVLDAQLDVKGIDDLLAEARGRAPILFTR